MFSSPSENIRVMFGFGYPRDIIMGLYNSVAVADNTSGRTPCNFLGHELPAPNEVLSQFGNATSDAFPQTLKVFVWNIYKGRKPAFGQEFKVLSADCNLVLLQEMALSDDLFSIYKSHFDLQWEHATNFMKNEIRTGVGTGSSSKPLLIDFRVTDDLEPFVKLPKTIVVTEYALQGSLQNLLVLNIHGINFKGTQGLENQINQVLPLIHAHQGPVLFAGDFNTKNVERVDTLAKMLLSEGLESVVWDNPLQGKQLDQAYVRGLKVDRAHILTDVLGSDHPALLLELSLPFGPVISDTCLVQNESDID